jgi:hypothetical protein
MQALKNDEVYFFSLTIINLQIKLDLIIPICHYMSYVALFHRSLQKKIILKLISVRKKLYEKIAHLTGVVRVSNRTVFTYKNMRNLGKNFGCNNSLR